MILWIILALLTLTVAGILLFSVLHEQPAAAQRVDYDVAVYRDQLVEIDRDVERGLLIPASAEAARAEIYRRMLTAEDAENATPAPQAASGVSLSSKLGAAFALLILLPLGAGLTYAYLGSPQLPARPYAERKNDPEFIKATEAEKLAAQLESKPDAEGYRRLGDTYAALRFYDQAIGAYQKAIQMNEGNAALWSGLGEAIALSHDILVVPEAREAFVKALRFDPHDARARFYLGLAEAQINQPRRAVAIWRDLEKDGKPDSPWLPMLRSQIAFLAKDGGFDPASIPPEPPSLAQQETAVPSSAIAPALPSGDAAAAIMKMSPGDQNAMIQKMVDRLASRMKDNPDDLDGWERLAKAYRVLDETDKANDAEAKAAALKAKIPDGSGGK